MPSSSTSKKNNNQSQTPTHVDQDIQAQYGTYEDGDESFVLAKAGNAGGKGKGKGRGDGFNTMKRVASDDSDIGQSHLLSLPSEILPAILSLIPPRQLLPLRLISPLFDTILSDDTIWRESYVNRFAPTSFSPSLMQDDEGEKVVSSEEHLGEESMRNDREERLKIVRSCIGTGSGGQGWKRESLGRESMNERFIHSKSATTVHSPHIDIVHALGLFYTPVQAIPFKMIPKLKTGSTKSSSNTTSTAATTATNSTDPTFLTPPRVGPKIIGAKSRQPHRLDPALNGGAGRAPNVISMGMNAGVAIRSDPLTGKCMQGYLGAGQIASLESIDRVPTAIHMAPLNPICCLWGLRSGHIVHSTLLNPLPTPGRLLGPSVASDRGDAHDGSVKCLWMQPSSSRSGQGGGGVFVSGGADGRAKLWRFDPAERKGGNPMPGKITSLWSSDPVPRSLATYRSHVVGKGRMEGLTDEIVVVRCDYEEGIVVGVTSLGRVWLWNGLKGDGPVVARRIHDGVEGYGEVARLEVVVVRRKGDEGIKRTAQVLVHPKGSAEVLRIDCPMDEGVDALVQVITFTTGRAEAITSLYVDTTIPPPISLPTSLVPMDFALRLHTPTLTPPDDDPAPLTPSSITRDDDALSRAAGLGDGRFIVAGTQDGWMFIWYWDGKEVEWKDEKKKKLHPICRWEAGEGAITCVTAAKGLVASGSFDGLVKIWDPLSLPPTHLRTVRNRHSTPPASFPELGTQASLFYSVNNIVLESDMIVASIGHHVLGWRAGSSKGKDGKAWKGQNVGRHSAGKVSPAKGYDQKQMRKDVHESVRQIAAEQSFTRTMNQQNNAVRAHYDELGFDSTDEAMQYALMVSQEESGNVSLDDMEMQAALDAVLAAEQGRGVVVGDNGPEPPGLSEWNMSQEDIEAEELREALEQIRLAEEAEAEEEAHTRSSSNI